MSAQVRKLRAESKDDEKFEPVHFEGATLLESETRHASRGEFYYMVEVDFLTLGPRFFGPFADRATAERFRIRAQGSLIDREQQCHADLCNGEF